MSNTLVKHARKQNRSANVIKIVYIPVSFYINIARHPEDIPQKSERSHYDVHKHV